MGRSFSNRQQYVPNAKEHCADQGATTGTKCEHGTPETDGSQRGRRVARCVWAQADPSPKEREPEWHHRATDRCIADRAPGREWLAPGGPEHAERGADRNRYE